MPQWLFPYEPPRWLRGRHAQTLAGNYWRRKTAQIPLEAVAVEVDATDGSRVLCHCHWQPEPARSTRLTILVVHGLEGSSNSGYMQGITDLAWKAGCNIIRMNMRNCGGTEQWTTALYHCGLSADVRTVLEHFVREYSLPRVAMVGYSMGGNMVLKLAGELGDQFPDWLVAAVGVSPSTDLAASADALHEPANRVYEWHFLRNLMKRFRRKVEFFPAIYAKPIGGPVRTIREFDDRITARFSGFSGADDYYYRCSSARVVSRIALPTLVLHALDDPFIRMMPETRQAFQANAAVTLVETERGGHCAFLARKTRKKTRTKTSMPNEMAGRHWAESTLMGFLMATAASSDGS